jgi:hypothetical protein
LFRDVFKSGENTGGKRPESDLVAKNNTNFGIRFLLRAGFFNLESIMSALNSDAIILLGRNFQWTIWSGSILNRGLSI